MRTYCIAQRTLLNALVVNEMGRKPKKEGTICICIANTLGCIAEINTTLQRNYTVVKIIFKKKVLSLTSFDMENTSSFLKTQHRSICTSSVKPFSNLLAKLAFFFFFN